MYYILGTPFWSSYECPWTCRNIVWYNRQNWTEEDRQMSHLMMQMWSNFAKYRCVKYSWLEFAVGSRQIIQRIGTISMWQFPKNEKKCITVKHRAYKQAL